ncbi:hypothetical protein [Sporosarcina obsidiansis]|uniref:hypothetical protein n=1 Tax=Sporosarcina obsidiansis TaxID=2660748 RepID=UPI00129A8A4A|nr:hypothetical protein [Sporosarcina obsidiansis]
MSVENQKEKFNEAEYFYSEMQSKYHEGNIEHFKYCVSAFSTAARSILQYAHDDAKSKGKSKKYRNLIKNKKAIKYFKGIRNLNIHVKPLKTVAHGYSEISASLTVAGEEKSEIKEILVSEEGATTGYTYHFEDGTNVLEKGKEYLLELERFISNYMATVK